LLREAAGPDRAATAKAIDATDSSDSDKVTISDDSREVEGAYAMGDEDTPSSEIKREVKRFKSDLEQALRSYKDKIDKVTVSGGTDEWIAVSVELK
jgi:hypothetical protein